MYYTKVMRLTKSLNKKFIVFCKSRHFWLAVFVLIVAAGTGTLLAYHARQVSEQVNAINSESASFVKEYDQKIADAQAAKAAALKAAQEAAAKQLAEDAANGTVDVANLNSKACNLSTAHNNPASIDVVVNKQHCIQPLNYQPRDLVTSIGATLSAKAMGAYLQLSAAATSAGLPIYATSSYRSYQDQVATYANWVQTSGRLGADSYSARPGYSEHQTGLAVDVAAGGCVLSCFGTTPQYGWLQQHAADYGFIQRYYIGQESITGYGAEEWHYRYVGIDVARAQWQAGVLRA